MVGTRNARPGEDAGAIRVEASDGVGRVIIDRPGARNALTARMRSDLVDALRRLDADPGIRAVVVTAEGPDFSVGMDVKEKGEEGFASLESDTAGFRRMWDVAPWRMVTPVIGALPGFVVGLGASMSLLFDVRFAADTARFAFVFPRRGLPPELDASFLLPRIVGFGRACDLLISGRQLDAHEAYAIGLVNRVLPEDELGDAALDYARDIAVNTSPESVTVAKRMLWDHLGPYSPEQAQHRERVLGTRMLGGADVGSAVRAFLEHREPQWQSAKHTDVTDGLDAAVARS